MGNIFTVLRYREKDELKKMSPGKENSNLNTVKNADIDSSSIDSSDYEDCESNNSTTSQSDDESQNDPSDSMIPSCPELQILQDEREILIDILINNKLLVNRSCYDEIMDKIISNDSEYPSKAFNLNFETTYNCCFDKIIDLLKSINLNDYAAKLVKKLKRRKSSINIKDSQVFIVKGTNNNIINGNFDECTVINSNGTGKILLKNPHCHNTKEPSNGDQSSYVPEYSVEETDSKPTSSSKSFAEFSNNNETDRIQNTKELILRPYQKELVNKALNVKNCIICAPTNSGKTVVATYLIRIHLLQKPGQKVAFIVPKRILINQQATTLSTYLRIWKIRKRAGSGADLVSKQKPLDNLIQEGNIIIMTADILKNGLIKKTASFSDFTLLVFDECHHCMDGHSYNEIMTMFLEEKTNNPTGEIPSIIGLTASPASKGKTDIKAIRNKIFLLCANLDAQALITVINNEESLKESISDAHREYKTIEQRPNNPFVEEIFKLMEEIEKNCNFTSTIQKRLPQYLSQISEMMTKAKKEEDSKKVHCLEMLKVYHEALRCNEILLMENAYDYLLNIHEELEKQAKKSPAEEMILKLFKDKQSILEAATKLEDKYPNPILEELKDYLKDQMEKNENDIKSIIFVRTKENARALKKILKDDKTLNELEPGIILGGNNSSSKGMKTKEQHETLLNFRTGKIKVIISTSVAEEGLDIPSCNLIVKYNYETNEVASYQMFGRARAENSASVSMGSEECSNKEMINYEIHKKIEILIKEIDQIPSEKFAEEVKKTQTRTSEARAIEKKREEHKYSKYNPNGINFKCGKCFCFICKATDIYQKDNNFVINWQDIEKSAIVASECIKLTYKISCKECSNVLGSKYDNGCHCLGIKHFVVEINGENNIFNQWCARTFYIRKE